MTTIKAIIKGRRVELDVPADWPDGAEVEIHRLDHGANRDSDELSPKEIAQTLAVMDQIQSFDMSDAEVAAWEAERRARKEGEKAAFAEHAERLRRQWE